ncbi:GNAT family N-acetyltransferase [Acidiphilium sp. AL]|uniref:GNAT family N-acetyltransferase n=1 Tax=Acidiphilium sp. AL TaxID=2871704 RepID=UPI0021CB3BC4|nr:GNAT family N-acetyltransferase [Acidiphilium sp. AL]MCU4159988.1 GNAT family N-acetyltransferase [Acidiphilium sp. AL]
MADVSIRARESGDMLIRAREPGDAEAIATLMNLPGVRFGTLRTPFVSVEFARTWMGYPVAAALVAERGGQIVGTTSLMRGEGRTAHSASMLIFVHDDHVGSGVGSALMAALLDLADNWLGLRRISLTVNADNARGIALYRKFGFEVEGGLRDEVLRDGVFIDSLAMARLRL